MCSSHLCLVPVVHAASVNAHATRIQQAQDAASLELGFALFRPFLRKAIGCKALAIASVALNTLTLIEMAANAIKGEVYIGRSPQEAFFTLDSREL